MKYSTKIPKVEGYYWVKMLRNKRCLDYENIYYIAVAPKGETRITIINTVFPAEQEHSKFYKFAGPIPAPEEA